MVTLTFPVFQQILYNPSSIGTVLYIIAILPSSLVSGKVLLTEYCLL